MKITKRWYRIVEPKHFEGYEYREEVTKWRKISPNHPQAKLIDGEYYAFVSKSHPMPDDGDLVTKEAYESYKARAKAELISLRSA